MPSPVRTTRRKKWHVKLRHLISALAVLLAVGAGVPVAAAQYPPTVGNGRVTRSEVKQCQCTQFSGDGFAPGATVTILDRGPTGPAKVVATVTADSKGGFKVRVCFDEKSAPGEHTLIARGKQADGRQREVRANVRIEGTACFGDDDEVHNPNAVGGKDGEVVGGGSGSGGSGGAGGPGGEPGSGPTVGGVGVGLPRTGADYVLPGLLFGFALVVLGTSVVHLSRRRRLLAS